jgi:hypothetical protein
MKVIYRWLLPCLVVTVATLSGCRKRTTTPVPPDRVRPNPRISQAPAGEMLNPDAPTLPDPRLTPGATLAVTPEDFCEPGYSAKVRDVPASLKKKVYAAYGITQRGRGEFEVDHLISLQLGGSNSIQNLWPQSYLTQPWNAHVKDALENRLHSEICSGKLDMKTAQREIATDWIAAYKKHFHTEVPLAASRGTRINDG